MSKKVTIETHRGLSGLEEIASAWNFINKAMEAKRFFHLADWYRCYLGSLEDKPDDMLFTVVYLDNAPEAVFPLKISSRGIPPFRMRSLQLPSHPHMCLNDFVVANPERAKSYMLLVLKHLAELPGVSWDYIYLPRVLEESSAGSALAGQPDILSVRRPCGGCDYLTVRPYDLMFRGFTTTFRNNLRRARKRADNLGRITFTSVSKRPDLDRAYEIFLNVEASGWKGQKGLGTAITLDKNLESFYRLLMENYSESGGCDIHIMWHDDNPIAVEFSLITDDTLYTLKIGYDESYSSCSPGHLLREYIVKYCEERGIRTNNLITDAPWHIQWKPQSYGVSHQYFCRKTVRGRLFYLWQRSLLQVRPLWDVLKPRLKSLNIISGRPVRV